MSQSTDPMRRSAERMRVIPPTDPEPTTQPVTINRSTPVDCRHRPYANEVARGLAEDHPPRLDITTGGTRVRLEIDPAMSARQVRTLISHLRPEVRAWLDEIAEYAHHLEMAEASADLPAGGGAA